MTGVFHMYASAIMSSCGEFRYELTRDWGQPGAGNPTITFVMLNPSTADAHTNDNTVTRCLGFAKRFGFQRMRVVNLFAYRATDPKDLKAAGFPIGPDNFVYTDPRKLATDGPVVCAWGAHARGLGAPRVFLRKAINTPLYALAVTADGIPRHPLYLPNSCDLIKYK